MFDFGDSRPAWPLSISSGLIAISAVQLIGSSVTQAQKQPYNLLLTIRGGLNNALVGGD